MAAQYESVNLSKGRNVLKSRHFRSAFWILFLSANVLFVFIGAFLYFQNVSKVQDTLETSASHAAFSIQEILNSVKNGAVMVGSLPSVEQVLNSSDPTVEQLRQVMRDVSSFYAYYDCDNLAIFFNNSSRIYDCNNGFYHYDDFIHQDLLEVIDNNNVYEQWLPSPASLSTETNMHPLLLTYIHRLPLHETRTKGYVALSISSGLLSKQASVSIGDSPYPATISFGTQLLWTSSSDISEQWDDTLSSEKNMALILPHVKTYSFTTESGTQAAFYVTNAQLWRDFLPTLYSLLPIWVGSDLLSLLLSVLFAVFMLRPMDALMRKLGLPSYTEAPDSELDEYSLLNSALDDMASQLKDIDSIMHQNEQLVRDQLLYSLLFGYVDLRQLSPQYEESGITFPFSNYCLILSSLPTLKGRGGHVSYEQVRLLARNNAINALSILGNCYGFYLGNQYTVFILNTNHWEHLQAELLKICIVLKTGLSENFSLQPQFSISLCSQTDPNLHQALMQAQRIFLFSTGETEEFVYFTSQQEYTPTIDPDMVLRFTQCIMNKDTDSLRTLTNQFSSQYLPDNMELIEAKRFSRIALCSIFASLMELNLEIKENLLQNGLSKVDNAQSAEECDHIVFGCLRQMTSDTAKISEDAHTYIRKAVRYLELHYAEPLSIPQIASYTGVSSIYLNRIFKLSTGKTLSDYLNDYRTAQSLQMLADESKTINQISESVGYNDVRSYIRFFKKFYGMTPSEYRKKNGY